MLLMANQIVNCPDLYPYALHKTARDYTTAADRREMAEWNLGMVEGVLAEAPEYFRAQSSEAITEEAKVRRIFLRAIGPWLSSSGTAPSL